MVLPASSAYFTTDGRSAVTEDPTGENFPWVPPTFADSIGDTFVRNDGSEVKYAELAGKTIAIYFSAHWCPPCKMFTPELVKTYNKLQAAGKPFEIIFASSDRDEGSFKEYFGEMPWLALPHGDARKESWSRHFGVQGIPTFVILDENLALITKEGRDAVTENPEGDGFPWRPKPPAPIRDA